MSYVIFNNLVDMSVAATPSSNGYTVAYDLDGTLKQKNQFGVVSPISSGGGILATPSLSGVLSVGNTTGLSNLVISASSSIRSSVGQGQIHFGLTDSVSYVYISSDNGLNQESLIELTDNLIIIESSGSSKQINLGVSNTFSSDVYQDISIIENLYSSSSVNSRNRSSIYIGTVNSTFLAGITNSVIIGGSGLLATQSNTVYLGNVVNINGKYRLPSNDGGSNQVMKTDGQGNLNWSNISLSLSDVLSIGNTTGETDLVVNSGRYLISTTGSGKLDLGSTKNKVVLSGGLGDSINISENVISIYVTSSSSTQSLVNLGINNNDLTISNNLVVFTNSNIDKNTVFISTKNSSSAIGISNSVILGGKNINATQSDTVYVSNLQIQGNVLAKYTIQPSTQTEFDDLSVPTKKYVDDIFSSNITGNGSASFIPRWSSSSSLSFTSSIFDSGLTVSVFTNMEVNGVHIGRGSSNLQSNTVLGESALNSSTSTGTNNTAIGRQALYSNSSGSDNTSIGISSLQSNNTGNKNTAIGAFSLNKNTTGYQNVGLGYYSLFNNTLGSNNVSIGFESSKENTTGSYNVSLGNESLHKNQTGDYNISLGYQSLYNNTSGSYNSALGVSSLNSNKTGNYNVAFGYESLKLTTGSFNVAIGASALSLSLTSSNNTTVGFYSLNKTTVGQNNTAIGSLAGSDNISGSNNTFLGYNTGIGLTFGNNNTFIGSNISVSGGTTGSIYLSDGSGNVRMMANSDGKVGVNTTSPSTFLDINGDFSTRHSSVIDLTLSNYNNYSTNNTSYLVFRNTTGNEITITGFSNGSTGKRITISNLGPDNIVLKHQDTSSSDSNRIITGNYENDLVILDNQTCDLIYDTIENKWRLSSSFFESALGMEVEDFSTGTSYTSVSKMIFRGGSITVPGGTATGVAVNGTQPIVTVWVPAPSYVGYFTPTLYSGTSRYITSPTLNSYTSSVVSGQFGIGSWSSYSNFNSSTTRKTINSSSTFTAFVESEFACYTNGTTMSFTLYNHDGTVLSQVNNFTLNSTTTTSTVNGITLTKTSFSSDSDRFKSGVTGTIDIGTLFPNGGRFSWNITHYNGEGSGNAGSGIYSYTSEDLFYDNDGSSSNSTISNGVDFNELLQITVTYSGVSFYAIGSQFALTASGINMINDMTFPTTKQIDFSFSNIPITGTLDGYADGTKPAGSSITGWTSSWNISSLTYSRTATVASASSYIPNFSTNNTVSSSAISYVSSTLYDWSTVGFSQSVSRSMLFDTYSQSTVTYNNNPLDSELGRLSTTGVITNGSSLFNSALSLTSSNVDELQYIFGRVIYPQNNFKLFYPSLNWSSNVDYSNLDGSNKIFTVYTDINLATTTSFSFNDYRWHVTSYGKDASYSTTFTSGTFTLNSNFSESYLHYDGVNNVSGSGDLVILVGIDDTNANTTPNKFLFVSEDPTVYPTRQASTTYHLNKSESSKDIRFSIGSMGITVVKVWLFIGYKNSSTGKSLRMTNIQLS